MSNPKPIVFISPGSGMGHAVRATAIGIILQKDFGENVTVVCSVKDTVVTKLSYVSSNGIQFVNLDFQTYVQNVKSEGWKLLRAILLGAKAVVVDTFPYGLVGEWRDILTDPEYSRTKFVYLARRMKWLDYVQAMRLSTYAPPFIHTAVNTVILEPLHHSHLEWIKMHSQMFKKLSGPVRLPTDRVPLPQCDRIRNLVYDGAHLVVASHTESEGKRLYELAQSQAQENENIIWVSPEPPSFVGELHHWVNYFPISIFFNDALGIYGTGSYNIMAETVGHRNRYHAITFERRYDTPEERQYLPQLAANGAYEAANFINQVANEAFVSI